MAKKKGKSVSFDAMVKFFMHTYDIPTKRDLVSLINRLDRIERLFLNATAAQKKQKAVPAEEKKTAELSAAQIVLDIIRGRNDGVGLAEIQMQSGFGEKKLRNILFRLNKAGKITRKSRGIYVAV